MGGATVGVLAYFGVLTQHNLAAGMIGNLLSSYDDPFYVIEYGEYALGQLLDAGRKDRRMLDEADDES